MMKGSNSLVLNEGTMIEIVQFWLNNKLLNKDEPAPVVTSFSSSSKAPPYGAPTFEVTLSSNAGGEGDK